jgi:hypothetical protein
MQIEHDVHFESDDGPWLQPCCAGYYPVICRLLYLSHAPECMLPDFLDTGSLQWPKACYGCPSSMPRFRESARYSGTDTTHQHSTTMHGAFQGCRVHADTAPTHSCSAAIVVVTVVSDVLISST